MRLLESLRQSSRYGNINVGRAVYVISDKAIREFKAARLDAGPALDNCYRGEDNLSTEEASLLEMLSILIEEYDRKLSLKRRSALAPKSDF
jgi:hypothetical protein